MSSGRRFGSVVVYLSIFVAVSLLATVVVVATLLDLHPQGSTDYRAVFTNASGLQSGDTVRIAGVEVGTVRGVQLVGDQAQVAFSVDGSQHLTTTTQAQIHYENLLGQRYLALVAGTSPGRPLLARATIPTSRTQPALDLTSVFNGFQPLFSALTPNQVNQLTGSIIEVFQGQSGTIAGLTAQTAALTSNLAQRQLIIDQVLTNLSGLLDSVGAHDQQLGQLIDQFSRLVHGLAGQRTQIAASIDGVSQLTSGLSGVLSRSEPALTQSINGLAGVAGALASRQQSLDAALGALPGFLGTVDKVVSNGSYLSVYLCNLTIEPQGQINISLVPGVAAPQPGDPITLPGGAVGDQSQHTATCQ